MARPALRRLLRWVVLPGVALFALIQLVPYGWSHPNPPVIEDPPWPSARAARLARAACYDCHSNETDWPAYSYVAPMSWLVRRDVEAGRDELNFSHWDADPGDVDDAAETVEDGSMPPRRYTLAHSEARLSAEEKAELIAALRALEEEEDEEEDRRGFNRGPG